MHPSHQFTAVKIGTTCEGETHDFSSVVVRDKMPFTASSDTLAAETPARADGSSSDQWAILGGMRFLLAMVVVLVHCHSFLPAPAAGWTGAGAVFEGQAAVCGFLFISGYSIAHSLRNPKGFYLRRVRRIMPLYLAGLLLGLGVVRAAGGSITMPNGFVISSPRFGEFVGNALLLQGWICATVICDGPLWTISAEGFYYLIAPLLKWARPWMLCALIWISAIAQFRCNESFSEMRWGYVMLVMAWSWLGGFYWYGRRQGTTMVLLLVMGCVLGRIKGADLADVTIVSTTAMVMAAPHIRLLQFLRAPLLYLGELSYPLYVFHWPTIVGLFALRGILDPIGWVIGSIGMSMIGYHLIDKIFRTSPLDRTARLRPTPLQIAMNAPAQV